MAGNTHNCQCSPLNYITDVRGNHKLCHVNMWKTYHSRDESQVEEISRQTSSKIRHANAVSMTDNIDEEVNDGFSDGIRYPVFKQTESLRDVNIDSDIQGNDRAQILDMSGSYSDILTDIPGSIDATQHVMTLSDNKPIAVRQYPLPLHYEDAVKKELTQLLNMHIVEFANSAYSSPILPVSKRDGTLRTSVDNRKMIQVTLTRQELMPEPENMFSQFVRARYFIKID